MKMTNLTPKQHELLAWLYSTGQVEVRWRLGGGDVRPVLCRRYRDSIYSEDLKRDILAVAKLIDMQTRCGMTMR